MKCLFRALNKKFENTNIYNLQVIFSWNNTLFNIEIASAGSFLITSRLRIQRVHKNNDNTRRFTMPHSTRV